VGSIADTAKVAVVVAEFAVADPLGKLNMIGGAFQAIQRVVAGPGQPGVLPAMTVVVLVELPPEHHNQQYPLGLALKDERDKTVEVPGAVGGTSQALRIQQLVTAAPPSYPGLDQKRLWNRVQFVLNIQAGVPVEAGTVYSWVVEIDGHTRPEWRATFYVLPDQAKAVLG
jgi:hypothetical protein